MSVLEQAAIARAAIERAQALQLAQTLQTRGPSELRNVASRNPALLEEWIAEIAVSQKQAQAEADELKSVLETLRSADTFKNFGIAA